MHDTATRVRQEIVRLSHQGLDLHTFLGRTQEQLRRVVPFDGSACFFTTDPATLLLTGHINDDLVHDDDRRRAVNAGVATNEYHEDDFNKFSKLARSRRRASSLSEASDGSPERSARYRGLMRPFGLEAELRAAFVADDACWGTVALFRGADEPAFSAPEAEFLHAVSRDTAVGIRSALVLQRLNGAEDPEAPGILLLDEHGAVDAVNPTATHWLGQLIDPAGDEASGLPHAIHAIAEHARAAAAGVVEHGATYARVPTRSGRWVVLHATALAGTRAALAIVIEPARTPAIAGLLLTAYGLSEREQAVTMSVLRGLSTSEIGDQLFISPYTVQDHLKAIFDKVGVRSRKALVARVFFDQYFDGLQNQQPVATSPPASSQVPHRDRR